MSRRTRRGLTLVELLVVIAIIGLLVGLLLPAVQSARESARRASCSNNLRQLALACLQYERSEGTFPSGGERSVELGWHCLILPFIEQQALYDQFDFRPNVGLYTSLPPQANKLGPTVHRVATFLCPSCTEDKSVLARHADENNSPCSACGNERIPNTTSPPWTSAGVDAHTTHYIGVLGPIGTNPRTNQPYPSTPDAQYGAQATGGILIANRRVPAARIRDGLSNTLLAGEIAWSRYPRFRAWNRGVTLFGSAASSKTIQSALNSGVNGLLFNQGAWGSNHPGGTFFCRADGSTTFVADSISFPTLLALASREGGETLAADAN
jgi:prepilin-type N-terminal cleavage/methylation domain-containing protein